MTKAVELHQAFFFWTCDECGSDQFERAITYDGPPFCAVCMHTEGEHEEDIEVRELTPCEHPGCVCDDFIPPDPGSVFLMAPTRVQCSLCGAEFETTER